MHTPSTRRQFLGSSLGGALGGALLVGCSDAQSPSTTTKKTDALAPAASKSAGEKSLEIYKSLKWGMIKTPGTVLEKFQLCKELGYDGMELVSPLEDLQVESLRAASEQTGMPIHGLVDMKHWDVRLSSPDAEQRAAGVKILQQAIRDAKALGGDSVLLVPGKVTGDDENHDLVWSRSIDGIREVLPLASRLGVRVLIENVWNGFCEKPEQLRDYLDEIDSPWVGAYFDMGNAQKFAPTEHWIRTLGHRIVKLDLKGWGLGMPNRGFCKIGDGTVDWPAVLKALAEIGFSGWCTAEVSGGDRERLADISQRMDKVLELR